VLGLHARPLVMRECVQNRKLQKHIVPEMMSKGLSMLSVTIVQPHRMLWRKRNVTCSVIDVGYSHALKWVHRLECKCNSQQVFNSHRQCLFTV
jgi:hypothetical protein